MDANTMECIKYFITTMASTIAALGLAYIAARWHKTPPGDCPTDKTDTTNKGN
jgi:hypothetical protein